MADSDIHGLLNEPEPAHDDELIMQKGGDGSTVKSPIKNVAYAKQGEVDSRPAFGGLVGFYGKVATTTLTELFVNGVPDERLVIYNDSMMTFMFQINIVQNFPSNESASFVFQGAVRNIAGTVSFENSPIRTIVHKTQPDMNASIEIDTVNDALILKVAGADTNDHYCSAQAFISEIR